MASERKKTNTTSAIMMALCLTLLCQQYAYAEKQQKPELTEDQKLELLKFGLEVGYGIAKWGFKKISGPTAEEKAAFINADSKCFPTLMIDHIFYTNYEAGAWFDTYTSINIKLRLNGMVNKLKVTVNGTYTNDEPYSVTKIFENIDSSSDLLLFPSENKSIDNQVTVIFTAELTGDQKEFPTRMVERK